MRIVETDNFGGDYPDESFVNIPSVSKEHATRICEAINDSCSSDHDPRWWKIVEDDYKLSPGFEP